MRTIFRIFFLIFIMPNAISQNDKSTLLIGTYTNSCQSDGIYSYSFDAENAETNLIGQSKEVANPSFLTISTDGNFIYSVNENGKQSTISAFDFNPKNGNINLLNKQSSEGADPCYLINDDKNVIVANYSGGNIAVFPKKKDGSLKAAKQVIAHHGHSSNQQRQEKPHVHMVQFSPDKKFVLANDLGTDRIYVYQYNPDSESQPLVFQDSIPIKTGSGPRHLAFSPNGKQVYLIQELDGTVTVFNYSDGNLRKIQETSVVTAEAKGEIGASAIKVSADGNFLYATNRGDANTISVFSIADNGRLEPIQTISTNGKGPRDFTIDPSGKFVLVANQNSNEVVIFKRDALSGKLTDSGKRIKRCAPVCLVFIPK